MTENAVSLSPEQDVKNNLKERTKETVVIKSETEYSQGGRLTDTSKTKDAETEAHTETDNVHVTAEVYSATDLPSSYQTELESTPKPGKVVPERVDDQYVVLRASRSKGVNTVEETSNSESCFLLKCIFPPIKAKQKQNLQAKAAHQSEHEKKGHEVESIEVSRQLTLFRCRLDKVIEARSNLLKCKDSCPNLVINRTAQTGGTVTGHTAKPKEQGDNRQIAMSTAVMVREADGEGSRARKDSGIQTICVKSYTRVDLGTIEEQEEPDANEVPTKSKPTKEDEGTETDDTICVNFAKEHETAEEETSEQISDTVVDGAQKDTDNEAEPLIVSDVEDESVDQSATDEQTIDKTQDAAVDTVDIEEMQKKKPAKTTRRPSLYRFETGTIISSQSITWIDSSRRRKHYKETSTRANDCFCHASEPSNSLTSWTELIQPAKNSRLIQCEAINSSANCSMSSQTVCDRSLERCNQYNCCFNRSSRSCDERSNGWKGQDNFWPSNCWSSKNSQSFGKFQEAFMNHQLCRINNTQGYSIPRASFENCMRNRSSRNNTCNQYYLNCNKADSTVGRYCWCNSGYSLRNTNMTYCAPSSQMMYQTPHTYYYSFRAWY